MPNSDYTISTTTIFGSSADHDLDSDPSTQPYVSLLDRFTAYDKLIWGCYNMGIFHTIKRKHLNFSNKLRAQDKPKLTELLHKAIKEDKTFGDQNYVAEICIGVCDDKWYIHVDRSTEEIPLIYLQKKRRNEAERLIDVLTPTITTKRISNKRKFLQDEYMSLKRLKHD